MLVPLTLPKKVTVNNYRLKLWFNVVLFFCIGILLAELIVSSAWSSPVPMTDKIHVFAWTADPIRTSDLQAAYSAQRNSPSCDEQGKLSYWFDAKGDWRYENHTCRPMCASGVVDSSCFTRGEVEQMLDDSIFFVTEVNEIVMRKPNATGPPIQRRLFVPLEHAYKFYMSYSYYVGPNLIQKPGNLWLPKAFEGNSNVDTMTVIIDENENVQRYEPPDPSGIGVSMFDIMRYAGLSDALDKPQPSLGRNYLRNSAIPGGPVARLTGLEIMFRIRCYNKASVPNKFAKKGWDGPVCSLQATKSPPMWVSTRGFHTVDGVTVQTWYHGVKIRFVSEGNLPVVDLLTFLGWAANAWVFLHLPHAFFTFVSQKCLGALSHIYRGVLTENFVLENHLCSLAMDVMSKNVIYHLLADQEEGISLFKMKDQIAETLSAFTELDSSEVNSFAKFCFMLAYDIEQYRAARLKGTITGNLRKLNLKKQKTTELQRMLSSEQIDQCTIDITNFATASAMNHTVVLEQAVKIFDRDRQTGRIERFFAPYFVRHRVWHASQTHEDPEASPRSNDDTKGTASRPMDTEKSTDTKQNMTQMDYDKTRQDVDTLLIKQQLMSSMLDDVLERSKRLEQALQQQQQQTGEFKNHIQNQLQSINGELEQNLESEVPKQEQKKMNSSGCNFDENRSQLAELQLRLESECRQQIIDVEHALKQRIDTVSKIASSTAGTVKDQAQQVCNLSDRVLSLETARKPSAGNISGDSKHDLTKEGNGPQELSTHTVSKEAVPQPLSEEKTVMKGTAVQSLPRLPADMRARSTICERGAESFRSCM